MKRLHALLVALILALLLALYVSANLKPSKQEPTNQTQEQPTPPQVKNETGPRPIYYFFFSSACPACKLMEEETLDNQTVIRALDANFTYKRINVATSRALAQRYLIRATPTNIFTYPDGTEIGRLVGAVTEPEKFLQMLDDVLKFYADHPQPQ